MGHVGAVADRVTYRVDDAAGLVNCFEHTAARVFTSVSHLTVGDRAASEQLLLDTYLALQLAAEHLHPHEVTVEWLLATAHQLYLRRAGDQPNVAAQHLQGDDDWTRTRWGPSVDALGELTALERTALNLHNVEGFTQAETAKCVGLIEADTAPVLLAARQRLADSPDAEPLAEMFRRTEIWLDDASREQVLQALHDHQDSDPRTGTAVRHARVVKGVAIAAAVTIVAIIVGWVATAPDADESAVSFDIPGSSVPLPTFDVADRSPVPPELLDLIPPVRGAIDVSVSYLATDLADIAEVRPEAIVRYADGKVGLVWQGPCNRPAAIVQVANRIDGVGIRLMTGAFSVLACTGMPERWTMVVQPGMTLAEGPILPIDDSGQLDSDFDGYSADSGPLPIAVPLSTGTVLSSALVDQANQPWSYGAGCTTQNIRYRSPVGPIFEVRVETDSSSLSTGDEMICDRLSTRKVLTGPNGATFPQPFPLAEGEDPIDCKGPFKSLTDVPNELTYTATFYDGQWSTWEGCLVNPRVIYSKDLTGQCGWADVHTITFHEALGERIGPIARTVVFVRDPDTVVPGDRPDFANRILTPPDAEDTGLRHGDQQLWLSASEPDSIYVIRGGMVERWPRLTTTPACD